MLLQCGLLVVYQFQIRRVPTLLGSLRCRFQRLGVRSER